MSEPPQSRGPAGGGSSETFPEHLVETTVFKIPRPLGRPGPEHVWHIRLEVVGVKAVRAFDGWVVVTQINGNAGADHYRLLGAAPCEAEEDLPGAAVKAVLNASNRVMEQRVAR